MKTKLFALLLAALMLLTTIALADGTALDSFTWGASPDEVEGLIGTAVGTEFPMPYADHYVYSGISHQAAFRNGLQLNGGLMNANLARADFEGYTAFVSAFCAYPLAADGMPARKRESAGLYMVVYNVIASGGMEAAYDDLLAKLTAAYGESAAPETADLGEGTTMKAASWSNGASNLYLSMVTHEGKPYLDTLYVVAADAGSDAMLDALTEGLYAEDDYKKEHANDIPGDANKSGAVDLADVVAYAAGNGLVDANGDRVCDMQDAVLVLEYLCGYGVTLTI